jgi:tetratricopeptide (TPR) repeat protein
MAASEAFAAALEHYQAGLLREAEELCQGILVAEPRNADVWNLLGVMAYQSGHDVVAIERLSRALESNPAHVNAHNNLGTVLKRRGRLVEAVACHRRALELRPGAAAALNNLGTALTELGNAVEAIDCFRQAIAIQPDFAEAHFNLGISLQQAGRPRDAADCYRRVVDLRPRLAHAHFNLAIALKDQGKFDESIACFRRVVEIEPGNSGALCELGRTFHSLGTRDEARSCYRRTLEIDSQHAPAHFHQAMLMLAEGDFEAGWAEYEWRWKTGKQQAPEFHQPQWDGEDISGQTILLCAEQGLGDTIQFVRYASLLKQLGATVVLQSQQPLAALLCGCQGVDRVISEGDALPPFDCYVPLLSLPKIFRTRLDTIPPNVPYLSANEELVGAWRAKLDSTGGFRIGINWHGGQGERVRSRRDIPLGLFSAIAQVEGVRLISLQKGTGTEQLTANRDRSAIVDLGEFDTARGAFMDTAAIMRNLDLVITSDTSIAHLAGALGVPVWVGLPYVPDWRWLLGRRDCPWYPTMQLFRQQKPGDWQGVLAEICAALQRRFSSQ